MQITLYNTCPAEYEKKFIKILKQVIRPALKEGKSVRVDEIKEEVNHGQNKCNHINHKGRYYPTINKIKKYCRSCHRFEAGLYLMSRNEVNSRSFSDTTMKIQIT